MPSLGKLPTEGRGLPFSQTLEEIVDDVVCEEGAHSLGVRCRGGRVEAPDFSTPNHGLLVIVSTNTRQRTPVVPSGVKLGPTHVAEVLEREDVRHEPGGLLAVEAWELALVPSDSNKRSAPKADLNSGSCQMLAGSPLSMRPKSSGCSRNALTTNPFFLAC